MMHLHNPGLAVKIFLNFFHNEWMKATLTVFSQKNVVWVK